MQEKTRKLITLISLLVAIVGSVFAVIFALNTDKFSGMYNIAYGILLAFIAVIILAILAFVVLQFIGKFKDDPKQAVRSLIGIGLLIVVALVAFVLSKSSDVSQTFLDKNGATESTSKMVGAGCIMVYILAIAAACSIVFAEVSKVFKKK